MSLHSAYKFKNVSVCQVASRQKKKTNLAENPAELINLIPVLMNLRARSKPFNRNYLFTDYILKTVSCSSWWKSVDHCKISLHTNIVDTICGLQTAIASSASVERVLTAYSSFGLVHSKLRNRLGV